MADDSEALAARVAEAESAAVALEADVARRREEALAPLRHRLQALTDEVGRLEGAVAQGGAELPVLERKVTQTVARNELALATETAPRSPLPGLHWAVGRAVAIALACFALPWPASGSAWLRSLAWGPGRPGEGSAMAERQLRERLEAAQARAQQARAALAQEPDVAAERAALLAEVERLEARRRALAPVAASTRQSVRDARDAMRRATVERWSTVGRGLGRRSLDVLLSAVSGAAGLGACVFWFLEEGWFMNGPPAWPWWLVALVGPAWLWLLYRLGRAS